MREPSKEAIVEALKVYYDKTGDRIPAGMDAALRAAYAIDFGPTSDTLLTTRYVKQLEAKLQSAQLEALRFAEKTGETIGDLERELLAALAKDSVKTHEINVLVEENRKQAKRIAELERLKVHCSDCGADYAATGIEAGCTCKFRKRIAALEDELKNMRGDQNAQ